MLEHTLKRMTECALLSVSIISCDGWCQSAYPAKPIFITVGLQAATGSDIAVRSVAERMGAPLGQPFVIENLPGASGVLAAVKVAKAPPDGYTLAALSNAAMTILPNLEKVPYDPFKDLVPVAFVSAFPSVLFTHPGVPAKSVQEFIALAKRKPKQLTYASGGNGSTQHLAMEIFKSTVGIDLLHVPYKGSMQATLDVMSGRVDAGFQGISTVLQFVQSGKLRALAWSGAQRFALFPELPTIQEAGVAGFVYEPWTGFFAPAAIPKDIVNRLNTEVRKASSQPDLVKRWGTQGLDSKDVTPEQLAGMIRDENSRHAKLISEKGIRID
jgi:tripartite-type tricarboxylate transporter receptor subunit TctC